MEGYTVALKGDKRMEAETQEQYKARLKLERKAIKRYLAGQTLDLQDGANPDTHWLERIGTKTRIRKPITP